MLELNLPKYEFSIKKEENDYKIFDIIRKKYLLLTPEEWVRQNFIRFLIDEKKFSPGLISVESGLKLNQLQKRTDILAHDAQGKPVLIVECKATTVTINQEVFDQIARYNMTLKVQYLIVTNGLQHYCCKIDHHKKTHEFLPDIPNYSEL